MLMFGVIMSGDTGEQVCVLQNASSARRKREVHIFDDEAMSPVRVDVRILHSTEVLGETCASWSGAVSCVARFTQQW